MANPDPHHEGEWTVYHCVANDFNRFFVNFSSVDVFVSDINWNDSGSTGIVHTTLGASGTEGGILFGVNDGLLNWLTSTNPDSPDHFDFSNPFEAVCVTGDSFQEDNTGGYHMHVREHRG